MLPPACARRWGRVVACRGAAGRAEVDGGIGWRVGPGEGRRELRGSLVIVPSLDDATFRPSIINLNFVVIVVLRGPSGVKAGGRVGASIRKESSDLVSARPVWFNT